MLIGSVMCDYVRLTSFDDSTGHAFRLYFEQLVERENWKTRDAHWMQYFGKLAEHGFCGGAIQDNRFNHLIHVSGEFANTIYSDFSQYGSGLLECTRFDVQVTLPMPEGFSLPSICESLRSVEPSLWPGKQNRGRKVGPLIDNQGEDTLYIGSRESDSFVRIYVKWDDERNYYVRFEVEFKGKRSRAVFSDLRSVSLFSILSGEFFRLPSIDCDYWRLLNEFFSAPHSVVVPRAVVLEDATYKWFMQSVRPALRRLLASHEYGNRTQLALWQIIQEVDVP